MRNFVITMLNHPQSVEVSNRCIDSGKQFNIDIEIFDAITPSDDLEKILKDEGIGTNDFIDTYATYEGMVSCFLSHYFLWKKCIELNEEITIFEHDAVIQSPIPRLDYIGCVNLGKPSYGIYQTPTKGLGRLQSMTHFPGTHCYRVNPYGAQKFIEQSKISGNTPDIFLHSNTFDFLEEYYPWPVISNDTFSTIQTKEGLRRKHSYKTNNLI